MPAREPSSHVVADGGAPGRTVWGEPMASAVTAQQTGGAFSLVQLTLPVGWRRAPYVHHGLDECFLIRVGAVRFWLEDQDAPVLAGAGDTVYVPRGLARAAELVGTEPGRVLLLQTPAPPEPTAASASPEWLEGVELLDRPTTNSTPGSTP